jgi:hypothetical protein
MRIILASFCMLSLALALAAGAQPVLQVEGPGTPGSIVSVNVGQAPPQSLAVAAYGYALGRTPLGSFGALDIRASGYLILGTVSSRGLLISGLQVPMNLPTALHGLTLYFQAAVLQAGPPALVQLTGVESLVLDVPPVDPTGVVGDA